MKIAKTKKNNSLASLSVRSVNDDIALLENGDLVAVIRCKGAEDSAKNVCLFRRWLESVSYPVQVSALTLNEGLQERIHTFMGSVEHRIKQKKNQEPLVDEAKSFSEWLSNFAEKNCKPERIFYITLKVCPDYETNKELKRLPNLKSDAAKLKARVKESLKLLSAFMSVRQLCSDELENIFSSFREFFVYDNHAERFMTLSVCHNFWKTFMEVKK